MPTVLLTSVAEIVYTDAIRNLTNRMFPGGVIFIWNRNKIVKMRSSSCWEETNYVELLQTDPSSNVTVITEIHKHAQAALMY